MHRRRTRGAPQQARCHVQPDAGPPSVRLDPLLHRIKHPRLDERWMVWLLPRPRDDLILPVNLHARPIHIFTVLRFMKSIDAEIDVVPKYLSQYCNAPALATELGLNAAIS